MSDELATIFADCLEAIERGDQTVDQCLAAYPAHRAELEPLLAAVSRLQAAPAFTLRADYIEASADRLVGKLRTLPQQQPMVIAEETPAGTSFWQTAKDWLFPPRPVVSWALGLLVLIFMITQLSTGAIARARPGDTLYALRIRQEQRQLAQLMDPLSLAEQHLAIANYRLDDLLNLDSNVDDETRASVLANYEGQLAALSGVMDELDAAELSQLSHLWYVNRPEQERQIALIEAEGSLPPDQIDLIDQQLADTGDQISDSQMATADALLEQLAIHLQLANERLATANVVGPISISRAEGALATYTTEMSSVVELGTMAAGTPDESLAFNQIRSALTFQETQWLSIEELKDLFEGVAGQLAFARYKEALALINYNIPGRENETKPTATATAIKPTETPEPTATESNSLLPLPSETPEPTAIATAAATETSSPTPTPTTSPTATITRVIPPTATPIPPSSTPVPPTSTPVPPTATNTPTNTPTPTATPTRGEYVTHTPTPSE